MTERAGGELDEYLATKTTRDGRVVKAMVRGTRVGRFGVRQMPPGTLLQDSQAGIFYEAPWVVDHIPSACAVMVAWDESEAMRMADDMSRFAAEDPDSTSGVAAMRQLGDRVDRWLTGTANDPRGERRGLRQWEADQASEASSDVGLTEKPGSSAKPVPEDAPLAKIQGILIIVYDHPKDFSGYWVVRAWDVSSGGMQPCLDAVLFKELGHVRSYMAQVYPDAVFIHGPGVDPDPVIHEVYAM